MGRSSLDREAEHAAMQRLEPSLKAVHNTEQHSTETVQQHRSGLQITI